MQEGHLPVLVEEVMSMLSPAPGSLQIDATVGGGGHTERILEATDPDGRLLGLDADGAAIARVAGRLRPDSAIGSSSARRTSGSSRTVAPDAGFGAVDGMLFDLGLSSFQLADARARLRLPDRRPARHALRHVARRARRGAARDARRGRADGAVPALRRGAAGAADRPGDRRRADDRSRSRPPRSWPRSSSASPPATRGSAAGSIPRRASSRRSGSRSTRSSTHSRTGSPPRSTSCGRAAGSSS